MEQQLPYPVVSPRRIVVEAVDPDMAAILRSKTEAERLQIGWRMWRSARDMLRNLIRSEHRDWPEAAVRREAAGRLAGGTR